MASVGNGIPPLVDLLQIVGVGGAVVGGIVGFAVPAPTNRELRENVSFGATAGGLFGALVAFVIAGVDALAGG